MSLNLNVATATKAKYLLSINNNLRSRLLCSKMISSNVLISESRRQNVANYSLRLIHQQTNTAKDNSKLLESENPYYEKYKEKFERLKKEKPELYVEKMAKLAGKNDSSPDSGKSNPSREDTQKSKSRSSGIPDVDKESEDPSCVAKQVTSLNDIMHVEKLSGLSKEEIEEIWKNYHHSKNYVCAVMSHAQYSSLKKIIDLYPNFLLALPKDQGFEFVFTQWQHSAILFTTLANYQLHKENAPIILTVQFYTELVGSRDIVLMRGQYDPQALTAMEAQSLVNQHQLFYNEHEPPHSTTHKSSSDNNSSSATTKLHLVKIFNEKPNEFDYNVLLSHIPGV